MRMFWTSLFLGGLLLAALSVYERGLEPSAASAPLTVACEDGTPMPPPDPPPSPKPSRLQ